MEPYLLIADQLDGIAMLHEVGLGHRDDYVTLREGRSALSFRHPMTPDEMRARAAKLRKQWAKRYRGAPPSYHRIATHRPKGSHALAACHRFRADGDEVVGALYPTSGAYYADV